ncbi:hypothetical protein EDC30_109149 [Paucimonas lemoignei]|uniref:Uncharacterized protein n=1 Tax=Paucimonas lemoignei TaxID=29443 RepID=A0A4R3HSC8_PAULE|nr:hypothetical protein EDC30_109149 [Paucimonas lemoignei]
MRLLTIQNGREQGVLITRLWRFSLLAALSGIFGKCPDFPGTAFAYALLGHLVELGDVKMNAMRLAILSCGCACAWMMQPAQADSYDENGRSLADEPVSSALAEKSIDADMLAAVPSHLASHEPAVSPTGTRVQFDSGTIENVHRIVGFWPSVHWLNSRNRGSSMAALGYTWRNLRLEGALFKERDSDQSRNSNTELLRMDAAKRRLAYKFGPNWAFQLSRGYLNTPDQFRQDQKSRRRTASLTYRNEFAGNPWHSTLAYARGKGSSGTDSTTYLLDTAMQLGLQHTVFGRIERGGHDELFLDEEGPRNRVYNVNKMSVGYLYEVKTEGPARLGVGGVVSRRDMPNELLSYYGDKTTSYTVFFRLQMKFN